MNFANSDLISEINKLNNSLNNHIIATNNKFKEILIELDEVKTNRNKIKIFRSHRRKEECEKISILIAFFIFLILLIPVAYYFRN